MAHTGIALKSGRRYVGDGATARATGRFKCGLRRIARHSRAAGRVSDLVMNRGEALLEECARLPGARTRIVARTHASNSLGTVLPVTEMTQVASRYGARVLVNRARTVRCLVIDL